MSFPFSSRIDSVRTDQISKNNDFQKHNEILYKFDIFKLQHLENFKLERVDSCISIMVKTEKNIKYGILFCKHKCIKMFIYLQAMVKNL